RAQRSAPAERTAAHAGRACGKPASARGHRRAAAREHHRGRVALSGRRGSTVAGTPKARGDSSSVALLDAPAPPHSVEAEQAVLQLVSGVIDQIDEWHQNPNQLRGLPTGFTDFDKLTGGLRPGDLVIVAGRPSMGKTTLAVNMAEYAAVHPGTRASVAIFSME